MKCVIVLSVSDWGAVFIFQRSRSTSLSPVICFVISSGYAPRTLRKHSHSSSVKSGGR